MACIQNQHIYTLRNCQGGTVIDLSGGDNYSSRHRSPSIKASADVVLTCSHRLPRPQRSQPGGNAPIVTLRKGSINDFCCSQWIFQQEDDGWFIKSVGADKYLGIEGDAEDAGNGTKVVASSTPCKWDVRDSDVEGVNGIR
jgi:hypothetical protein